MATKRKPADATAAESNPLAVPMSLESLTDRLTGSEENITALIGIVSAIAYQPDFAERDLLAEAVIQRAYGNSRDCDQARAQFIKRACPTPALTIA